MMPHSQPRSPPHSHRPHSPKRPHFLTLCTDRPSTSPSAKEQFSERQQLAPSSSPTHKTKIRLISPLKHANLPAKENNASIAVSKRTNASSPLRPKAQIELGGKSGKNLNEISNISIKEHLKLGAKQATPLKPSHKYAAFIITTPPPQSQHQQPLNTPIQTQLRYSPFKKPQVTINSKPFYISALHSQIIHVSPFKHIRPALPPPIQEENESTLKEECEEEVKDIKEMRKQLEAESSRIKEALKASRTSNDVCVSHLVYANEEELRSHSKNNSKMFNFEDVPLHQSLIQTEEHLLPLKVEQSLIKQPITTEQAVQQKQAHAERKQWVNSEKTLINQLNFATCNKLSQEKSRDEVCQTAEKPSRFKLAIVRNEECRIQLQLERQTDEKREVAQPQLYQQGIRAMPQLQAVAECEHQMQLVQSEECIKVQDALQLKLGSELEVGENPQACISGVPSVQSITELHQSNANTASNHGNQSNLSLELEPHTTKQTQEATQCAKKTEAQCARKQQEKAKEGDKREETTSILSLHSVRSNSGKAAMSKRSSKRSIHNSIYL